MYGVLVLANYSQQKLRPVILILRNILRFIALYSFIM